MPPCAEPNCRVQPSTRRLLERLYFVPHKYQKFGGQFMVFRYHLCAPWFIRFQLNLLQHVGERIQLV